MELESQGAHLAALALYSELLEVSDLPGGDTSRALLYRKIGENLWALGRPREALAALQQALELRPADVEARSRLAGIYLAAGALGTALQEAQTVLQDDPEHAEALTILGAVYVNQGKTRLAKEAFNQALRAEPQRVSLALALADLHSFQGESEQAREVLQRAAAMNPGTASPLLALGRLEEQEGRQEFAEQSYRRAVGAEPGEREPHLRLAQFLQRTARIPEAEAVLQKADALEPGRSTSLADFHLVSGRPLQALQQYLRTLHRLPEPRQETPEVSEEARGALAARIITAEIESAASRPAGGKATTTVARRHLQAHRESLDPATAAILEAEIALVENDLPTALEQSEAAVEQAPNSAAARYLLGRVKHRQGDEHGARDEWLRSLELDPAYVPVRMAIALDAMNTGHLQQAEEHATYVVREEPGNFRALILYARVLLRQERYPAVRMLARRAKAVDPSSPQPHLLLGETSLAEKKLGQAMVDFQQAVLLDAHSANAIHGLMRVYKMGAVDRATLRQMEKIAEASPPSATLMEIVGRLYADRGHYADSRRALQRALEIDSRRSTAALALGHVHARRGELQSAIEAVSRSANGSAALLAALHAQEQQQVEEAIRNYEFAVRHGDPSGVAANNLAWLYAERGIELDRALALARQAQELKPRDPAVLNTLGVVHLRRREFSEAIALLERALEMKTRERRTPQREDLLAQFRSHLEEAYLLSGQPEQASQLRRSTSKMTSE